MCVLFASLRCPLRRDTKWKPYFRRSRIDTHGNQPQESLLEMGETHTARKTSRISPFFCGFLEGTWPQTNCKKHSLPELMGQKSSNFLLTTKMVFPKSLKSRNSGSEIKKNSRRVAGQLGEVSPHHLQVPGKPGVPVSLPRTAQKSKPFIYHSNGPPQKFSKSETRKMNRLKYLSGQASPELRFAKMGVPNKSKSMSSGSEVQQRA